MKKELNTVLVLSTMALASSLTACGGGGGGDAGSTSGATVGGGTTTLAASPVVLTGANQTVASQDAMSAAFAPLSGGNTLTGAQITDENTAFSFAREQMAKLPTYVANAKADSTLTGAVSTRTGQCTSGGSLTVSVVDADNNGVLSAGDNMTIVANNCVAGSSTLNGSLGFAVNSLSGTLGAASYNIGVTLSYGNLTVTAPQLSTSINGTVSLSVIQTAVNSFTETISSPSLTMSGNYAGTTRSRSLTNYSATTTKTPDATYGYLSSFAINGTVTSTGLTSQSISFATSPNFVRRGTDFYPSSGVMVITGASNSKLRVTALSNTQVRQELDANGDGTYETSASAYWYTLL